MPQGINIIVPSHEVPVFCYSEKVVFHWYGFAISCGSILLCLKRHYIYMELLVVMVLQTIPVCNSIVCVFSGWECPSQIPGWVWCRPLLWGVFRGQRSQSTPLCCQMWLCPGYEGDSLQGIYQTTLASWHQLLVPSTDSAGETVLGNCCCNAEGNGRLVSAC